MEERGGDADVVAAPPSCDLAAGEPGFDVVGGGVEQTAAASDRGREAEQLLLPLDAGGGRSSPALLGAVERQEEFTVAGMGEAMVELCGRHRRGPLSAPAYGGTLAGE